MWPFLEEMGVLCCEYLITISKYCTTNVSVKHFLHKCKNIGKELKFNFCPTMDSIHTMRSILINVLIYRRSENMETVWKAGNKEMHDKGVWNMVRSNNSNVFEMVLVRRTHQAR